jgi:glutathione S-transferase
MPRLRLITFGCSHFCEKARWALDWHGIAYEEVAWAPGPHLILAKRYGAKGTTVPILLTGNTVIQGSSAIIDWAERHTANPSRSLNLPEAIGIERRADNVIGVHVRRLRFAETLPRLARLIKPALFQNTSRLQRIIGKAMWSGSRRAMMRLL